MSQKSCKIYKEDRSLTDNLTIEIFSTIQLRYSAKGLILFNIWTSALAKCENSASVSPFIFIFSVKNGFENDKFAFFVAFLDNDKV